MSLGRLQSLPTMCVVNASMRSDTDSSPTSQNSTDDAVRSFQRLASGMDPALPSTPALPGANLATSPSVDFSRPNWLSVKVPSTMHSQTTSPRAMQIREAQNMVKETTEPTTTQNDPKPLLSIASAPQPPTTPELTASKPKTRKFWKPKTLKRLFSAGSKKNVQAPNEDEPPVYDRATLETGISEAYSTQTTQALNITQPNWQMDTTQSMIAERPGPKRIPRRSTKGADACRLVWDYASARTQTKKPMESISILKKLLLQARSKPAIASDILSEIISLTKERDKRCRLSGWELLYLFVMNVPSGELGRVKFPGRASEEKGTVAEATQLATANVQQALTLVLNHGARKQLPSKEELHAFIQQRDALTSVRLMNGAKADVPFEIHETVKDCIPKMARTLGLKTHKSFGLFISHLNKQVEEVMVRPDAYMGDVVEALRQGILQGMEVELLVKRWYFGKHEDFKREPLFTDLTFLQVRADYLEGKYPLKMAEAAYLTALSLHSDRADHSPLMQNAEQAAPVIKNHSPPLSAKLGLEWHKEVTVVYGCLTGLTKLEAQRQFLTLLGKKAFGLSVFFSAQPFQGSNMLPEVILGFNSKGLHIFNKDSSTLTESVALSRILHYGIHDNSIMLEIKRSSGISAMHFSTHEGQRICSILQHNFNEALARLKEKKAAKETQKIVEEKLQSVQVKTLIEPPSEIEGRERVIGTQQSMPESVFLQPAGLKDIKTDKGKQSKRSEKKSRKKSSSPGLMMSTLLLDTVYSLDDSDPNEKVFRISSVCDQSSENSIQRPATCAADNQKVATCMESSFSRRSRSAESIHPANSESLLGLPPAAAAVLPPAHQTGETSVQYERSPPSIEYEVNTVAASPSVEYEAAESKNQDSSLFQTEQGDLAAVQFEDEPASEPAEETTLPSIVKEAGSNDECEARPATQPAATQAAQEHEHSPKHSSTLEQTAAAEASGSPSGQTLVAPRPALSRVQEMIQRLNQTEAEAPNPLWMPSPGHSPMKGIKPKSGNSGHGSPMARTCSASPVGPSSPRQVESAPLTRVHSSDSQTEGQQSPKSQVVTPRRQISPARSGALSSAMFSISEDRPSTNAELQQLRHEIAEAKRAKDEADARITRLEKAVAEAAAKEARMSVLEKAASSSEEKDAQIAALRQSAVEAQEQAARDLCLRAQEMLEAKDENTRLKRLLSDSMRTADSTSKKEEEGDNGHIKSLSPEQLQALAGKSWNLAVKLNNAHEEIATLQQALSSAIQSTSAMGTAINPAVRMDLLRTSHLLDSMYDDVTNLEQSQPPAAEKQAVVMAIKDDSPNPKNIVYTNRMYDDEEQDIDILLETCPGFFEEELIN